MSRTVRVALIQFDARPEAIDENLGKMRSWVRKAADERARWVVFHEATLSDYTPNLAQFAQSVPGGSATHAVIALARETGTFISFGLAEKANDRFHISQVFVGPAGYVYHHRKTWLWRELDDAGYRNEWARYDPGSGPELFTLDGVRATCFICADGNAPRCIERARALAPQVVFYPNNRLDPREPAELARCARTIGAPLLVTNRTGLSWMYDCRGGCAVYSCAGELLAQANTEGREELLLHDLNL